MSELKEKLEPELRILINHIEANVENENWLGTNATRTQCKQILSLYQRVEKAEKEFLRAHHRELKLQQQNQRLREALKEIMYLRNYCASDEAQVYEFTVQSKAKQALKT